MQPQGVRSPGWLQLGTHPCRSMCFGSSAPAAAAGECGSVRCSDVDQHWLILGQAQVAINMLLMLPKLVIEEIVLQTLLCTPCQPLAQLSVLQQRAGFPNE